MHKITLNYSYFNLQVRSVIEKFGIRTCIGLGVGLGANVLARYAKKYPESMDGLITFNCDSEGAGYGEWAYHKFMLGYHCTKETSTLSTEIVNFLTW